MQQTLHIASLCSLKLKDMLAAMCCHPRVSQLSVYVHVSVTGGDSMAAVYDHHGQHQPWSSLHCTMGVQHCKFCLLIHHQWQPFVGLPHYDGAAAASPKKPTHTFGSAPDHSYAADGAATPVVLLQPMSAGHCLSAHRAHTPLTLATLMLFLLYICHHVCLLLTAVTLCNCCTVLCCFTACCAMQITLHQSAWTKGKSHPCKLLPSLHPSMSHVLLSHSLPCM